MTRRRWSTIRFRAGRRSRFHRSGSQQDTRGYQGPPAEGLDRRGPRAGADDDRVVQTGLLLGLLGAVVLVYLLIVVNFQSWLDPFIIITALPAALAGIVWMLFLSHTTVSVPALTGAIMCMGVATANSVLVVSFARERMDAGDDAYTAALQAGFSAIRPGIDDGARDDHRHDPDGVESWRGRGAERAAGESGHRRLDFCDSGDAAVRAGGVCVDSRAKRRGWRAQGAAGMSGEDSPRGKDSLHGVKRFLWILAIAAVVLAIWGVVSRVRGREKIGQETSQAAIPVVRTAKPTASPASDELVVTWKCHGIYRGADLCAYQRVSEELVYRHRYAGEERAVAGGDRDTGGRSAVASVEV